MFNLFFNNHEMSITWINKLSRIQLKFKLGSHDSFFLGILSTGHHATSRDTNCPSLWFDCCVKISSFGSFLPKRLTMKKQYQIFLNYIFLQNVASKLINLCNFMPDENFSCSEAGRWGL